MPIKKARFRFKKVSPKTKVRLAFVGKKKLVEVTPYHKKNKWVRGHTRKMPK